jgi:hypothetical protein
MALGSPRKTKVAALAFCDWSQRHSSMDLTVMALHGKESGRVRRGRCMSARTGRQLTVKRRRTALRIAIVGRCGFYT